MLIDRTYGQLALTPDGRQWELSGIEPHVAMRLKGMFARICKAQAGTFTFPNTPENCAELDWFAVRYPMDMADHHREQLAGGIATFKATAAKAMEILSPTWTPPMADVFREGKAPYDYQAQNAELGRTLGRLLIMDDAGLGKTISALRAVGAAEFLPAAIVVQTHLPTQWVNQFIAPFTTLRSHIIQKTTPYTLPESDLYIFKYSNISGWVDVAHTGAFRSVVFDEIQELRRGTDSQKGIAARVFCQNTKLRLGLSATPIFNYGTEIFNIIDLLAPGALGTFEDFLREWCSGHVVKDPDALGTYLREQHLTVKRDRQGRPVNTIPILVPYDEEVEAKELDLARELAMRVVSGSFHERGQASREFDALLRQITGVAKARHVAAYVRILLDAGTPIILAGWHRAVYDIWLRELSDFNPVMYTGTESPKQKDAAKDAFINGETNLFIISLRSGAGLDGLQKRCHTVVIGELDWSPQVHNQLIWRVDRPGQLADEVTAIFLHADGGSDPELVSVLGLKASQARGIVNPLAAPQVVHTDESRIKKLAEAYLARRAAA